MKKTRNFLNNYLFLKITSIIAFIITVGGMIYLVKTNAIITENIFVIIIQILSVMLMIWARIIFGFKSFHAPANAYNAELVTKGPYKWLCHPIYASIIYFSLACIVVYPNIKTIIAVILIVLSTVVRMLVEEKLLLEKFESYGSYCKQTKRFIPFVF